MYILGVNIGHNATACLLKKGKIIGCVQEERFSRVKNHSGIPFKSINYLLKENNISMKDIQYLVLDDHYPVVKDPDFGKRFLDDFTSKSIKNKVLSKAGYKYPNFFEVYYGLKKGFSEPNNARGLKEKVASILKLPKEKVLVIDHHLAHAFAPCFNLPKNEKTLIFTLDGEGSGVCATVNIYDGENLKRISVSDKSASLGYLYAITTIFLGMKPLQHEFKVMGLAPYSKEAKVEEIYPKFQQLVWLEDLKFRSRFNLVFSDHFLEREMKLTRFDVISGAVQKLVEELTLEWISKAIEKTGINNIALSGGVFMNVKANQRIAELNQVKKMFIMPSCGDESNAIGACFYGYKRYCKEKELDFSPQPIKDLYLGPKYDHRYVSNLIKEKNLNNKYRITKPKNINKEIARLLAKGHIVARCSGRSEWGARALGNRSILANPKHPDTIRILNETIKDRDFWMPFTPSIIEEDEKKYVSNPKKVKNPYMVITFNSTAKAQEDIPAAMHPYDFTLRPQIVYKDWNPDYHEAIKEFKKLTGIGGILNTSFNLHGEPNVLTPEDALHTVENSSLNYLALGNYLFEKIKK